MEQAERLSYLENVRDWQTLVEELERGISGAGQNAQKAAFHLQLGRVLEKKFLAGVKALKHFQDAYKLNPALLEALAEARGIYWDLGKLNMVQKLLELELKAVQGAEASKLLVELGDVLSDLGDNDKATATYARALAASGGDNKEASACLEDVQAESGSWEGQVAALLRAANDAAAAAKGRLLVRAARIARRFAPNEMTAMLSRAYGANPHSREVAALYEGALAEHGELARLEQEQQGMLKEIDDRMTRARLALVFGTRWVSRHQNADVGARFLEEALKLDPTQDGAFFFLREVYGKKGGDWDRVLTLAEEAMTHAGENGDATFLLAQAGTIAWREMGNLIRAKNVFARLASAHPDHPQLRAFEAQIGEKLGDGAVAAAAPAPTTPRAPEVAAGPVSGAKTAPPPPEAVAVQEVEVKVSEAPPAVEQAKAAPVSADEGKIAELRALADKQEGAKRFNEYVKTLLQLAAAVDNHEKVELYMKAADLYVTKFANQAEAVKAYEAVVAIDAENATAIDYLRQMYEKRRDWEKLLGLQRREAENLPAGPERAQKFLEMAKLATERVKKPDVCIELWNEVIQSDDQNPEALSALSVLYERNKDFEKLAAVLEKQAEITYDNAQKIQVLNKLGTIYGDRLNNDEGAVTAWRTLLTLDPNDRKAQEAIKKKYLALGRWDDLEVFYAETGKWDEFIRVLEQQEAKEANPQAKIGMLFKIAELWADKKQKADRAAKAYEKALELEPTNLRAAESLIPIYTAAGNAKLLANAIEVKLSHQENAEDKLHLLREVAALYEGRVKEPQKAFDRYLSAFEIAPHDEQSSADAERAAKATQGWDRLIAAYRSAIDAEGTSDLAIQLRLKLGRVLVGEVQRIDEALATYRAVYDADGENADAIRALEALYRQTQAYSDLLGIYEKKRDLATDPHEKKAINYEIAKLFETEVKDVDKAIETYVAVLEEEPTDVAALTALDVLYGRLERWEPYVDVLRRRIELDNDEKSLIDLKFRLGSTLEKHLNDAAGALENYREILFLDAQHEGAKSALEAMLTHPELKSDAASILESIYEEKGEWNKLIGALDILAESEADVQKRVTLRRKIARISSEALTDYTRAFDALAAALKEDPAQHDTRFELEKVAEVSEAQKRLVELYSAIAKDLSDAQLARDYWMKVAAIDEQLALVEDAGAAYAHVLEIDAADAEALAALEQLYVRTQRWDDLIGVIQRRIDLAHEPEAREALYMSMAQVQDERLGKPTDAVNSYRKVLELDPQSARALAALDAILVRQKMWPELAENLEAQLALTTDEAAQISLMLRLAALRESEMNQIETAIEGYRSVLEREVNNAQALAALERLGTLPDHELAIAEILEPLYRHLGDHTKLIGVHEVQVRRADDVARKVELLHQVAQLYEDAAGDLNQAFLTYARALKEDAGNEETQQQLERVARATSRFQDLAHVYEELGGTNQDVTLASALWSSAARVYEQDIQDQETAIARYRKVLEIDAANLAAAESLERLFRTAGKYPELSQILQRKAEILEEPHDKKEALFQAAAIEEDMLERPEEAIAVYKKVLDIDGDDVRALDALIKRYLGLSNWPDLLAIYARKADLVADPEEKKRIYYQVGATYERELGDVAKAIDTYSKILELDPDDLQALSRLDVLYEQAQNWQELLSVLTRESEMTADPAEAISFQYRIADLYEKRLEDVARAIELYRDILSQSSDHQPTLQALEGLKNGDKDPLGAAAVLEPVYEAASDWPKLVSVHEVQVAHTEDVFQKVELLHRISRLHEDAMDNHASAFDTYARAVAIDNGNQDTLGNLERIATLVNRWPEVAKLYDAELDKLTEAPDRFVELGLRVAQIYETQLEDVENAIGRYRRVAEVDAENQNAVRALDRLFSMTERWQDLAAILAREAEIGQTPDEILDFRFRLGQVYEQKLQDVDHAIASYREVINAAPEHVATMQALEALFGAGTKQLEIGEILEPLYRSSSDWDKLSHVYEAQLVHTPAEKVGDAVGGQEDRLAAYYRIAELHEEKLVDAAGALEVYIRALKEYPLDEKSGEEVARLAAVVDGGWDHLANAYADIVSAHEQPEVQRTIGKRLAHVFEDELGDITKAEETYKYVLSVEELDTDALSNLDRIYLSLESWPELAHILEQRIKAAGAGGEGLELVEFHARLGEIYETKLNDPANAIRVFRRIFDELEKTHEAAIAALARIYAAQENWPELLVVHERELENASGDAAEADIRAKIGLLLFEKLGQPERSIEMWKAVLDLRGEDAEALGALANLFEQQQQWRELIDVLERQCEAETADDQRVNILSRKARMFTEKLGNDQNALEDWNRVLDLDFANLAALRAIAAIRRRAGDPTELVNALHQIVDRAAAMLDSTELIEVFRELGKTYGEQLGQPFDAADAWRKLLEVGPDFEAMNALEAIYRGEEKWTDVIDVKMQRAAALEDPAQKIEEYRQVAQLWRETVQEPDSATLSWQKILEIDGAHDEAFNELEKLHTAAGRWEPLVELYLARLESREETADKTDLLRRIAKVFEEHLDDRNQALDALLNALGEDFHDRETARYLERMAQATGRWNEVITQANQWLKEQTDPHQKIRLCLHLAKWYGDDLGKPEYAQPYYAQIVQLDPNNVGALRQMGHLYKKSGNNQQYGHSLTKALEVAVNDIDRKEIQNELGELLDSSMNQTDQAIGYFQRALEVDPQFLPAIENLERIYTARGQNRELVDILTRKVSALQDPPEIANTKLRIGSLYEGTLADPNKAAQVYRETLDVDHSNLAAMRGLARTCEVLEQWSDLIKVLEQQLDVVTTERERIDVLMQLANIQEEHFLKSDIAAQRLEQVVEIDPSHEDAYRALERNYRKMRQWHELVQTYERHISATLDRATKVELYGYVAQVQADEIGDADKAIEAYTNLIDLDEHNIPALDALSKLHDKRGDATQAIDFMTRVADLTQDSKQRVESFYRIGKALDEKLGDRVAAQDRYEMALDIDPTHLLTIASLRAIAMDNADYDKAARLLDQEQQHTQGSRQKARLLVELGNLREQTLGEHEGAVVAWAAAVEADNENEDAALPLGNHYIEVQQWERAEPLFDLLVRKAGKRERAEQHDLQNKLGQVCAALNKDDKALKAYTAAHQLDITDQVTIKGLAEVSFRLKDWGNALTNYQKVLTALAEDEAEARAEVYYRLGCIKREQGQAKQAINNFEKALSVNNAHRPTLEAMVSLYTELRDYKQVVAYKRQILDNVYEEPERFTILNQIGETWRDLDKNPNKAIEAFEEARDLQPQSHSLLHTLLALYQQVENWPKMIDTIQQIADLEKDPIRKSKFIYTMAQIYRDKENDQEKAVELFNAALDLNPTFLEAFERINKILTGQKEWKQLERAFRKMLKRMAAAGAEKENADLAYNLWHNLGIIYRDRLHDMQSGIEAFKMATRYKPNEAVERQILAELFEATDQMEAAIGEHAIVLQQDPMRVDPYRSLYKLYMKLHEYDRAWCMCAALAFLHKADEEEQRFFEDYRPRGMIQVKGRLDNEQWVKNLFHKDENLYIGKIFEMITPAAIVAKTTQLRAARQLPVLDKRFKQDPATSTVTFAKTFGWATQVLGVPQPELYVRSDVAGALVAVPAAPPASVAGQTVLTGFSPQELTFIVGKHLSYYRGEHYIKNLFPTLNELKVLLFAAIKVIVTNFEIPAEMAQAVNQTAAELVKYMQPVQRDGLRIVVQKFVEDGARADLKKWMQMVEVTACRCGLLLCADMEIAKKIVAAEPQLPGDLQPAEKMKELLVFSVSEQYFALRKALGIAVG